MEPNQDQNVQPHINLRFLSQSQYTSIISSYLGPFITSSLTFIILLLPKISMKFTIKIVHQNLIAEADLLHINGLPVKLPQACRSIFFQTVNGKENQSGFFYYSNETEKIRYKYKIMLKSTTEVSTETISYTSSKLIEILPKINLAFQKIGFVKSYNRSFVLIKSAELKLKKYIVNLLQHKDFVGVHQMKEQKERGSAISVLGQFEENKGVIQDKARLGGYCHVERKELILKQKGKINVKQIAVKKLTQLKEGKEQYMKRVKRQWFIISQIQNPRHFITYYRQNLFSESQIMMDYIQTSLTDYLYCQEVSLSQIAQISQQICQALLDLHDSGIVHRDLKPENIMVTEEENGKILIKLIDFAESTYVNEQFSDSKMKYLGCTLPFSPLECLKTSEKGFNKKEIDYWSICLVIHEIFFKRQPLYNFKMKVPNKEEFVVLTNIKKRRSLNLVFEIIAWLSINGICMDPQERLNPFLLKKAMTKIKQFVSQIQKIA